MSPQGWINLEGQEKKQGGKDINDQVKVNARVVDKQATCIKCPTTSIVIIGKETRLAITYQLAQAITEHEMLVEQVNFQRVGKVQWNQVGIQVVLLEDEKWSYLSEG